MASEGQGRGALIQERLCCIGRVLFPEPGGEHVDGSFIIVEITIL